MTVVVHLTSKEVASLEQYRQWMNRFGGGGGSSGTVQHIMANTAANGGRTVMSSSAAVQAKLNVVAPEVFPMPSTSWLLGRPDGTLGLAGAVSQGHACTTLNHNVLTQCRSCRYKETPVACVAEPFAARAGASSEDFSGSVVAGHNLVKYWLRPIARQGVDTGADHQPFS